MVADDPSHDDLETTNFCVPILPATDARPPSSFGQDEEVEGKTDSFNQPHTVDRLVTMGDHIVERLGLENEELNPKAPLEN